MFRSLHFHELESETSLMSVATAGAEAAVPATKQGLTNISMVVPGLLDRPY